MKIPYEESVSYLNNTRQKSTLGGSPTGSYALRVILFDVQHGFCAFVKSPTGHTQLIDCGRGEEFSPVKYILGYELDGTVTHNGHRLTRLTVTHPHDDHIEDIANVKSKLPPAILFRQQYNWEAIKDPTAGGDEYENLDAYAEWQKDYSQPVKQEPNWGIQIQYFYLTPNEAYALDRGKYINNSSIVTAVSFTGSEYTEKFLFGADVEQAGWEALLKRDDFRKSVHDTDFYIVPHHGHSSGFSTDLYRAMGRKPFVNLVSVHSRDENVDSRYSSNEFVSGVKWRGETRYMLSTRNDGSIFIDVNSAGKYLLDAHQLPANVAEKPIRW